MNTSTVTPTIESAQISEFARGVREALADLPAEEVEDLTEGLEADLAESLAEDLRRTLPDPVAYAAELRLAAGLPGRVAPTKWALLSGLARGWRETRADVTIAIRRNPTLAATMDFLVSVRPVWWGARAWVATWLAAAMTGRDSGFLPYDGWWAVLAAALIVSVQWGRGKWRFRGLVPVIAIWNVIAVIALIPVLAEANSGPYYYDYASDTGYEMPSGIAVDGEQVRNVFAYDAEGNPLTDVQLFDETGRALAVSSDTTGPECIDDDCNVDMVRLPSVLVNGKSVWNVFPLSQIAEGRATLDDESGRYFLNEGVTADEPMLPFVKVPALQVPEKVAKSND